MRTRSTVAAEEASPLQAVPSAQSNGSSQSKRPKRNVQSTHARDSVAEANSPINSQGGVTSSSPDEAVPEENGASTVHVENRSKDGEAGADTTGPESPGVIDAEHVESKLNHSVPDKLCKIYHFYLNFLLLSSTYLPILDPNTPHDQQPFPSKTHLVKNFS